MQGAALIKVSAVAPGDFGFRYSWHGSGADRGAQPTIACR